jgi:hypothetical protein
MLVNASAGLRELRVLHGPQGYERTDRVELQALSVMPVHTLLCDPRA